MRPKEVIIEVDEEGNCSIEAINFTGPVCETVLNDIAKTLGSVESRNKKKEYYQKLSMDNRTRIGR